MAIAVENVTKHFGDFAALEDVSVDVPDGSLTALLGPSGGGKSTLLRVIAGLELPDKGIVRIAGEDVTAHAPQKRDVGFVFQHYAAFKHLTVRDNVAFGLKIRKRGKAETRKTVDELLELVQLGGLADRYPDQLSGGQRQRMALARALAVQPRVLLLDEPFGALDVKVRADLRAWLLRLHDEWPVTTIIVTHDREEAMELASQIVVVRNGRVEQTGTPDELYDNPGTSFVAGFIGPVANFDGRLVRPHDLTVLDEAEPGTREALVRRVARVGFEVRVQLLLDSGDPVEVLLTRREADALEIEENDIVHVRSERSFDLPVDEAIAAGEEVAVPEPA
ncbi:MAG: TOBE-like domain-containing protein [Thermoleophilaceae bacterium]|nr:TOBE-like domain-containing protein [Thermoleophilaceae bacterium]